jgi:hypothetical protein
MHKIRPVKVEPLISTTDIKYCLFWLMIGFILGMLYLLMGSKYG